MQQDGDSLIDLLHDGSAMDKEILLKALQRHENLPHSLTRDSAMKALANQFDIVLALTNLKISNVGEPRTLYSLRHSSIMFRLMFGRAVDTLTLARNARTSPEMIDRFYAAPLQGEMNVGELQSKRRPRPWELSQGR